MPDSTRSNPKAAPTDLLARLKALLVARNADPFGILGPQPLDSPEGRRWAVRFFQPRAADAQLLLFRRPDGSAWHESPETLLMRKLHPEGFFEVVLPGIGEIAPAPSSYRIRFRTEYDEIIDHYDTYAFPFLLTEFDLYLMGEGRHYDAYEKLGAHIKTVDGVTGVHFAGERECAARQRRGRFQPLGRPREPDAVSWFVGDLGIVYSGVARGHDLSVRNCGQGGCDSAAESGPLCLCFGVAAE